MKKAVIKTGRSKAGFIRSTLAPVNDDHEPHFGWMDLLLIVALIGGTIALARMLLAH